MAFNAQRTRRWLTSVTTAGDAGQPCRMLALYVGKQRIGVFSINDYQHPTGIAEILEKCNEISQDDIEGHPPHISIRYVLRGFFGENPEPTLYTGWTLTKAPEESESDDDFYTGGNGTGKDIIIHMMRHDEVKHKQHTAGTSDLLNKQAAIIDKQQERIESLEEKLEAATERARLIKIREEELLDNSAKRAAELKRAEDERADNQKYWGYAQMAGAVFLQHLVSGNQPKQLGPGPAEIGALMMGLKTMADTMTDEEVKSAFPHMTQEQGLFIAKANEMKNGGPTPSLDEVNAFLDSLLDEPERTRNICVGLDPVKQAFIGSTLSQRAMTRPVKPRLHVVKE